MRSWRVVFLGLVLWSGVTAGAGGVAQQDRTDWPVYLGDAAGTKYSPLSQINRTNIKQLEVLWKWKVGEKPLPALGVSPGNFEATPLMIDGVLYLSTMYNRVVALNAETGAQLWAYDPKSYEAGPGTEGVAFGRHRGVATWTDGKERRIYINTRWRLIALNAKTGHPATTFGRESVVDLTRNLPWPVEKPVYYMNTTPPVVYKDLVIVGSAISDRLVGKMAPRGDVQAFNARTGKPAWMFHTIPLKGEFGYDTWKEGSADYTGHANVWVPMALDEARGLLYMSVSTPAHDYYGGLRKGNNLFADSIVCVEAATGKRVWHFQTIHHGLWDYDGANGPSLVTIKVDGKTIDAVAAAGKDGFVYVFDRVTGKPVWPIEERPVPQTDVEGEETSPTQPFPTKPPPFAKQGFGPDDVVDYTPALKAQALEKLKTWRYGPLFTPPSLRGTVEMPADGGGSNWGGSSIDPETGMLYVRARNSPTLMEMTKIDPKAPPDPRFPHDSDMHYRYEFPLTITVTGGIPIGKPPYATLTAYDLNKGDIAWQMPLGDSALVRNHPLLKGVTLPKYLGGGGSGGMLVTKGGLVFAGADERVLVFDKSDGTILAELLLEANGSATPMTYLTKSGRQILVTATGNSEKATLVAFALPSAKP